MFATVILAVPVLSASLAVPELFLPSVVSTGHDDSHVAFSPDGETMYFLRNTPDFRHWTVMRSNKAGDHWREPEVAPFSGEASDADVFITKDGSFLFFVSTRDIGAAAKSDTDIWMMERDGDGWAAPRHVPELSSGGYEWFPTMTGDGTIYFGSERPGGYGKSDLWRAEWTGNNFTEPENLGPVINTDDQEIEPLIADDGSYMIFAARGRVQAVGAYDLYVTYNCRDGWTEPKMLDTPINSEGWDFAPRFSPDRQTFYFTSNRRAPFEGSGPITAEALEGYLDSPGNGLRDIYRVSSEALQLAPACAKGAENR